jgi:hypothetical protein
MLPTIFTANSGGFWDFLDRRHTGSLVWRKKLFMNKQGHGNKKSSFHVPDLRTGTQAEALAEFLAATSPIVKGKN